METGKPIACKPIYIIDSHGDRIPISISTALLKDETGNVIGGVETFRDLSLVEELRKELRGHYSFTDIISRNKQMFRLFDIMPEVAVSESAVLLEGESGTGKELFARAIHNLSPRENGPLISVNCGALPDTLLESELFGYAAGAFTGADRKTQGKFEFASGGTLILDEVGDLPLEAQAKLLRALEEKKMRRVGGNEEIDIDVRVICITNRNLTDLVQKGGFREDLFSESTYFQFIRRP